MNIPIRFRTTDPPATAEQLADAELALGFPLPGEYRAFLQQRNGGRPEPNFYPFPPDEPMVAVTAFYAVDAPDRYVDLVARRRSLRDRIPESFLAAAEAEGGNVVCLSLRSQDAGTVHYWDHEMESEEGVAPTTENLTLVAPAFSQFVEGLRPANQLADPEPTVRSAWDRPRFPGPAAREVVSRG